MKTGQCAYIIQLFVVQVFSGIVILALWIIKYQFCYLEPSILRRRYTRVKLFKVRKKLENFNLYPNTSPLHKKNYYCPFLLVPKLLWIWLQSVSAYLIFIQYQSVAALEGGNSMPPWKFVRIEASKSIFQM